MTLLQDLTVAVESIEDSATSIATSAQAQSDIISGGVNDFITVPAGDIRSLANAINEISQTNPTGVWVTSTQYFLKDIVSQLGIQYICLVGNVSGVFATDLAAGFWGVYEQPYDTTRPLISPRTWISGGEAAPLDGVWETILDVSGTSRLTGHLFLTSASTNGAFYSNRIYRVFIHTLFVFSKITLVETMGNPTIEARWDTDELQVRNVGHSDTIYWTAEFSGISSKLGI